MGLFDRHSVDLCLGLRQKLKCSESKRLGVFAKIGVHNQLTNLPPAPAMGVRAAVIVFMTVIVRLAVSIMIMGMIVVMLHGFGQFAGHFHIDLGRPNAAAIYRSSVEFGANFERAGRLLQ